MSPRWLSVRVEVEVDDLDDGPARELGVELAAVAERALRTEPDVRRIQIASYVLRKDRS